jgi:hypothetical protein
VEYQKFWGVVNVCFGFAFGHPRSPLRWFVNFAATPRFAHVDYENRPYEPRLLYYTS